MKAYHADQLEGTWLWAYWQAIQSGEAVVGLEIEQVIRMVMNDISDGGCFYDTKDPERIIGFIENCCTYTKSPFYGKPFRLMLWQKAFLEVLFGTKMSTKSEEGDDGYLHEVHYGEDRFQRALLLVARKNGKSELSSALINFFLFAGGQGLDIVCSSNDDKQAQIVYGAADTMREILDPKRRYTRRTVTNLYRPKLNNRVFKLSDKTQNKEGYNIDLAIVDEVHEMKDAGVIKPIEQSQSTKPNPKLIMITTEGFQLDGFLAQELDRDRKILAGEADDIAAYRVLPWLYTQDSTDEIWTGDKDNRAWMKSNPSLGLVKRWAYLQQQVDLAKTTQAERAFVLAKDFNVRQTTATAWLKAEDIDGLGGPINLRDFAGSYAIGAVDIAETTDLECARIGLFKGGKVHTFSHYWIPAGKLERANDITSGAKYEEWAKEGWLTIQEGQYLDPSRVASEFFLTLFRDYKITTIYTGYDVRFATSFIKAMGDIGLPCEVVPQRPDAMYRGISMAEADILSRSVVGFSPIDKWTLSNASLQVDNQARGLLVKIRGQKGRKIDGAVTLAIMYEVYLRHRQEVEAAE